MPTFAQMRTPNGHQCGEVASALQKAIRRSDEGAALYWATELDLAGYGNYAFKRLRIIASEDVGLADPMMCVAIRCLYENWLELHRAHKGDGFAPGTRLMLVQAVIMLSRAPKSRMVDHAVMAFYEGEREPMEVPDHALDMHTSRGRSMKRGLDHFFDVGAKVVQPPNTKRPAKARHDPYAEEGRAARKARRGRKPEKQQLAIGE